MIHTQEKNSLIGTVPEQVQTTDLDKDFSKSIILNMLKVLKEPYTKVLKPLKS